MANNIVGIEEIPNLYPSACSFNGDDKNTAEWFVRVVNPDVNTDTLLIGSVFFNEIAKRVGYVKLSDVEVAKRSLEGQLQHVADTIDSFASHLVDIRNAVSSLDSIEKRIADLRKLLAAAGKLVKDSERSGEQSADGSPTGTESPRKIS